MTDRVKSWLWDWRDKHSRALGIVLLVMLVVWVSVMTNALASIGENRRHAFQRKCDEEFRLARTASDTLSILIHTRCETL